MPEVGISSVNRNTTPERDDSHGKESGILKGPHHHQDSNNIAHGALEDQHNENCDEGLRCLSTGPPTPLMIGLMKPFDDSATVTETLDYLEAGSHRDMQTILLDSQLDGEQAARMFDWLEAADDDDQQVEACDVFIRIASFCHKMKSDTSAAKPTINHGWKSHGPLERWLAAPRCFDPFGIPASENTKEENDHKEAEDSPDTAMRGEDTRGDPAIM